MNSSTLARLPFLRGAPQPTIAAVKRVLRPLSVTAGTVLFRTGDDGDACYFVEEGSLSVTTTVGGEVLATLGPGTFVGELALLLGEPRSATVTALADAKLSALTRDDLDELMEEHPALSVGLTRELGRRIVTTNQRFAGDRVAHRCIVWPASQVGRLAEGVVGYDRRVAVGAIAGATLGSIPAGATRAKAPDYGRDDARLDAVLIGAGDAGSARAANIVAAAEHVLCFAPPPKWLVDAAPANRLVMLPDTPLGFRRGVRWATGRAVGVALSSGGSKAVAHLGVLGDLLAAGIEMDAVSGSSGGAVAAAALAFGKDEAWGARCVADLARMTNVRRFDLNLPPRSGLAKGRRLRDTFTKWELGERLEHAEIPLWLVASDMATGGTVVMHEGNTADAIRASLSVPFAFDPWRIDDKLVIDGAIANPLPTDVLRDAGVGIVIASNVAGQATTIEVNGRLPAMSQVMSRMLNTMERERIRTLLPLADVVIRPRLTVGSTFDFSDVEGVIAEGRKAAQARLGDIRSLLAAASGHTLTKLR